VTAVNGVQSAARRLSHNEWLERLTRIGLVGYGLTHLLVGWLALQLAFGKAPAVGDQSGAFQTLVAQPFGRWLLLAVCVGLVAMAIWQALAAAVGHVELRGRHRAFERVASACKAVVYAFLAYKAGQIVAGAATSAADQQQQTTSTVLGATGGRWLVGLAGLAIAAVGAGLVWYGVTKRFERNLKRGAMSRTTRKTVRALGIVGYAAKGVAYATVGVLVVLAAVQYQPGHSRGLDQALRTLAAQPYGDVILIGVALGFAAYGIFCFYQSRYRRI
jgi:hypothetical protein